MKLLTKIAFASMALFAQFAHADTGPYYVSYPGYCNVKKVYLTPGGDVYGTEIGCANGYLVPVVGSTTTDGKVAVATIVNSYPCMTVYWPDGSLVGGCSAGSTIIYPPRSTWTVRMDADTAPRRKYNLSTDMPDISKTQHLPATEF